MATTAATLGTAPLIALHFGQASLVSLPANVLAAPAVAPAMWLAMLAAAVGQLGTALAAPFVALAGYPVAYVMWVAHVASGLPGAQASVPAGLVAAACLAAAVALAVRRARPLVVVGAVVIGLRMGDHEQVEPPHAGVAQALEDRAVRRPGVDEDRAAPPCGPRWRRGGRRARRGRAPPAARAAPRRRRRHDRPAHG